MLNYGMFFPASVFGRFWLEAMKPLDFQTWDNGTNKVVKDGSPYYKVRLFPSKGNVQKKDRVVCFFPPHAGRHPNVTDALIRAMEEAGFDVIVFELLPAVWGAKTLSLENVIEIGLEAYSFDSRERIVGGVCQGMWQSAITTAIAEQKPVAQFGVAGPIDFWAGDGYIKNACQHIPPGCVRGTVALNGGIQPGWIQWLNFFNMNPWATLVDEPMNLFSHILAGDEKAIASWHKVRSWHRGCQNLWGESFVEIVEKLFVGNQLVRKELKICGQIVDLARIDWPFSIYAGDRDEITPPAQSFALEAHISSGSVTKCLLENCGHTAAFNRRHALDRIIDGLQKDTGPNLEKARQADWIPSKIILIKE